MLTTGQIDQYKQDGYIVPDYRISSDFLEAIDIKVSDLLSRHPEFRDNCSALLRQDIAFSKFCSAPGLLDMVCQLIGPDIALWNMSLFGKPACNGKATPWHQDGEYWPIRPLATCSVWIAIDDSTVENGCLQVMAGSHRARSLSSHRHNPSDELTLHEELESSEFDPSAATNLVLERGQVSFHDVYLMHGSEPNRSDKMRRAMTMRLMPTTSHYDRAVANQMHQRHVKTYGSKINFADNPVFLLRGIDRCGKNNFAEAVV